MFNRNLKIIRTYYLKKAKNKKKLKKNLKIQHTNIRTKKGAKKRAKKEPNRNGKERLKNKEKMLS